MAINVKEQPKFLIFLCTIEEQSVFMFLTIFAKIEKFLYQDANKDLDIFSNHFLLIKSLFTKLRI